MAILTLLCTSNLLIFFEVLDDINRCKLIICETRLNEQTISISKDILYNIPTILNSEDFTPPITLGKDYAIHHGRPNTLYNDVLVSFPVVDRDKDFINFLVKHTTVNLNNIPASNAKEVLSQLINHGAQYSAITVKPHVEDLSHIRAMTSLCKAYNVPMRWFAWERHDVDDTTNLVYDVFKHTTNVFDYAITTIHNSITEDIPYDILMQNECDCGHFNANIHSIVADKVYQDIKKII